MLIKSLGMVKLFQEWSLWKFPWKLHKVRFFILLKRWFFEFFVVYQRLYRLIGHLKLILNLVLISFFVKNDKFSKQKKWVTTWRFVTLTTLDRKIRFLIKKFYCRKLFKRVLSCHAHFYTTTGEIHNGLRFLEKIRNGRVLFNVVHISARIFQFMVQT